MPRLTAWIPHKPTPKQHAFLLLDGMREVFYGGAAGGGKSDALLMAALQYVDVPGYSAIIFRKTFADLALPGAIMDRARAWIGDTAKWDDKRHTYTFPSGARLAFGYLKSENDKYRYQSAEFQFIAFDELTQFNDRAYRYLFSRLRRLAGAQVPLRMRSASNPGGIGHEFVYNRFVHASGRRPGRVFIPAKLQDNPHLDQAEYVRSLQELDDITRQQLLDGVWILDPAGRPFLRAWYRGKNRYHIDDHRMARQVLARWLSYDTGYKDTETSAYSSYSVYELLPDYRLRLRHVWRDRLVFPDLIAQMPAQAARWNDDKKLHGILIEDKASGISAIQTLRSSAPGWMRELLIPFDPAGSKLERARRAGVWCRKGCVLFPHPGEAAGWLYDFESEFFTVPDSLYWDQVDPFSQAVIFLEHLLAEGLEAREGAQELET